MAWLAFAALARSAEAPTFERDVWPILATRCTACHGGDKPKGGLDLTSVAAMLRGGESGPALVRARPEASLLVAKLDEREMPPAGERQLLPEEIATIRSWIASGAPAANPDATPPPVSPVRDADRQFWSFRPLAEVEIPRLRTSDRARTPIDEFLLAKLEAKGLAFSPDAEPATLVRRAALDLLGLPPEPAEVAAFLADRDPGAYERLLDRLLASPHFGERWGRHWLDVAGYVDTIGFDVDATLVLLAENKWLYRDFVIRSFNEDKPFDQFLCEQLAGDEMYDWRNAERLTPAMRDALVATGYLRTARDLTHEDVGLIRQNYFGIMHDTLETVGTGLLGLTINCARCHSHKFDPIPQEDYYRMMALLSPAYNPHAWQPVTPTETRKDDRTLADVSPLEKTAIQEHNDGVERELAPLRQQLSDLRQPHVARLREEALAKLPEAIRADVKQAVDTPADKRNEVQKYLAEKLGGSLAIKPEQVDKQLPDDEKKKLDELKSQIASIEAKRKRWGKIQALYDVGPPPPAHLLVRGSEESPGQEVPPGFLRVLSVTDAAAVASASTPMEGTSGRRTALARWLTRPGTPASALVARVMVNRVWQQLFGRGIVATGDNFGAQGKPPTHPELLEWLSRRFIADGWKIKPLIKQMMLSSAYRQASRRDPTAVSGNAESQNADSELVDPGNELLWRMRLRRLESEIVRDSILAVSGALDRTQGGPPVPINAMSDGMVVVAREKLSRPADAFRRSVYLVTRRAYNLSLLTVFDQPLVATNCLKRDASAVPLQSLVMLNDAFVQEQADRFAARIELAESRSPESRIAAAFVWLLARGANREEMATCRDLLRDQADLCRRAGMDDAAAGHQALVQLCHTLMNTSEFLYVE